MIKNKKVLLFIVALFLVFIGYLFVRYSMMETVKVGNVGLKINLYGSDKGLQKEELEPGRYFCTWNEDIVEFPVYEQNYVYSSTKNEGSNMDETIYFQSIEGNTVSADIGVSFNIIRDSVDKIYKTYRKQINEIISGPLRNSIRDNFIKAASKYTVEEIYSNKKNYIKDSLVLVGVRNEFNNVGIYVSKISYVSPIRLPESIQKTLESKTNAIQRAIQVENESREEEAKAKKNLIVAEAEAKQILIKAQAEAESNRLREKSLTPLLIQQQAIEKWDGRLPTMMNSGQQVPFIQVK